MKRVNVEVWSDFACPWCWIAKRRLEEAALNLAGQVEVVVTPKSYRLAKGVTPLPIKQVFLQKFGNAVAAERMMALIAENGAMEGLTYNFETMRFGDTSDAHALVKGIETPEDKLRVIERLYKAYTTDGVDIFDREVLTSLASEMGISTVELNFDSPRIASEIAGDEAEASNVANGVPLFVFNRKFHMSGASDVAAFEKSLLKAAVEVSEPFRDVAGATCGIDGCSI